MECPRCGECHHEDSMIWTWVSDEEGCVCEPCLKMKLITNPLEAVEKVINIMDIDESADTTRDIKHLDLMMDFIAEEKSQIEERIGWLEEYDPENREFILRAKFKAILAEMDLISQSFSK